MRLMVMVLTALQLVFLGACEEKFVPPPKEKPKTHKDNIKKVETAVPYGKKVACADIFAGDKVGAFLNDMVEIKDKSDTEVEATSVCAVMRGGEPPKMKQPKDPDKIVKNRILGVLPGDEFCTITLYCSRPKDMDRFKKKCEEAAESAANQVSQSREVVSNRDLDQYSCVHKSQRADKWAYTYNTIHKGTGCTVRVMGGPSVTDEPLVQNCTKAALELLTMDSLKNFK